MNNKRKIINLITKVAIFSALSFTMYWIKFPIFAGFPFLEIQFSNVPAILGGLILGPIEGALIVVVRFLLKLPFTRTAIAGELSDLIIGLFTVIVPSVIYKKNKNKKIGIISLIIGWLIWIIISIPTNAFIVLPMYGIKEGSEIKHYLIDGILPFNAILSTLIYVIILFIYKPVSKIFHKDFFSDDIKNKKSAIICCDSFKGSMTSTEVNNTVDEVLQKLNYKTKKITISDGGEGFLEALLEAKPKLEVHPYLSYNAVERQVMTKYLYDKKNQIAYFCLADTVGITVMNKKDLDPLHTNTYGFGLLIKHAIAAHPIKKIVFGIGGSASTDAGTGLLEALGVKFFNNSNKIIIGMNNERLGLVDHIDTTMLEELLKGIEVYCLTDVVNPLYGKNGAAYVYGPQKGASKEDVKIMDKNLIAFSKVVALHYGIDQSTEPGTGAAGGVGFAAKVFMKANIKQGIHYILDLVDFENLVNEYDMVITGEGAIDSQSLSGKVISGILEYKPKCVKLICGMKMIDNVGYDIYSIVPNITESVENSMNHTHYYLSKLIETNFK